MRQYLQDIRTAMITAPQSSIPAPIVVAAHGPKLMQLASEHADGAMSYMQPAETVSNAREILGSDKELCVVARCVRGENKQAGRDIARKALAFYISLPAYHRAWQRLGYSESDWSEGGSDRLIDSICGCGDTADIAAYLESLEDAGASHIIVSPMHPEEDYDSQNAAQLLWDWELIEGLAQANEHNVAHLHPARQD